MDPMTAKAAVLVGPRHVEVRNFPVHDPGPGEVLIETLFTGISAGTEMNVYRGRAPQWQMHRDPATGLFARSDKPDWSYPFAYGYANVGRIVKVGTGVDTPIEGDVVFSYSPHQSLHVTAAASTVPVPKNIDPKLAVLNANLNTALNGLLDARPSLGDVVVV